MRSVLRPFKKLLILTVPSGIAKFALNAVSGLYLTKMAYALFSTHNVDNIIQLPDYVCPAMPAINLIIVQFVLDRLFKQSETPYVPNGLIKKHVLNVRLDPSLVQMDYAL
jgi:hypothetical protein